MVYVAPSGNDQNNGATTTTAVKSVARGLALAAAGTEVRIAAGVYDEQLPPIPQGVTLSGGWDSTFTDAKRTTLTPQSLRTLKPGSDKCTSYTCLTNSHGDRVVTLRSPGGQQLQQLVVLGPNLSSRTDGSSSFAVVVDGASNVRLDNMSIEAGTGATGMAGENKLPPTGTCTHGGTGGGGGYTTGQGDHFTSSCDDHPANAGESVTVNGVVVAQGGAGGPSGHTSCGSAQVHTSNLSNGQTGGNGQGGIQGPAGVAAPTDPGYFTYNPAGDLVWVGSPGNRGGDGSHGAGGGGGAAGDTDNVYFWCGVGQPVLGGSGHNGGDGGCGGGGGGGGNSGGGAFALVVADTTVGSAGLALFGGTGGQGGQGGASAAGSPGVKDDTPGSRGQSTGKQCCWCIGGCGSCGVDPIMAGTGGAGGHGGDGGGGGGGAGGNGGPSIQLVSLANGALSMDANASVRYAGGRSGTGGTGGKGVQDSNTALAGNGGTTANQLAVPLQYIAATASNNTPDAPPAQAVDGNFNTAWNAGGGSPAWIELDLKGTVTLAKVNLLVGQSPAGPTTHQLYFGASPAPTTQIATESIATTDGQWLIVDVSTQKPTGRYLRVLTTASPSWVAWREIVVQTQ